MSKIFCVTEYLKQSGYDPADSDSSIKISEALVLIKNACEIVRDDQLVTSAVAGATYIALNVRGLPGQTQVDFDKLMDSVLVPIGI